MMFQTSYSVYEIDFDGKRIRRHMGAYLPTPRQSEDKEWKNFVHITPIQEGKSVFITWAIEGNVHKGTQTSPVVAVLN